MSATPAGSPAHSKAGQQLLRMMNRDLVLGILRQGDSLSRIQISRRTQLSKPTVSAIIEDLLREGMVHELGPAPSRPQGGRPAVMLRYNPLSRAYVGIQFGATVTRVVLADSLGGIRAEQEAPAVAGDFGATVRTAVSLSRQAMRAADIDPSTLAGVGAAIPGPVSATTGAVEVAPRLGWRDVPLRSALRRAFRVPVTVRNTTAAAAIAEGAWGAAMGVKSYAWVYAGTGIGAGLVADGALFAGVMGFAGEIGHCQVVSNGPLCACGRRGCVEALANREAIVRLAGPSAKSRSADEVIAAAEAGHAKSIRAVESAGESLGMGISLVLNVFNPEMVVVGGPLVNGDDCVYLRAVRRSAATHSMAASLTPVVASIIGRRAPLLGAILLATGRIPGAVVQGALDGHG